MFNWPVLVKSIKSLGNKENQGRVFGLFEAGRGLFDTLIVFIALSLFAKFGSLKIVILLYSITSIIMGVIAFFVLEKDEPVYIEKKSKFNIPTEVIKSKEIWLVSLNIFCAYAIYCGLTYMMPFLQFKYEIGAVLIGIYGMVNQYGVKMLAGPLGGYLADKKFKSSSKYFKFSFILVILVMFIMIILSDKSVSPIIGFVTIIIFGALANSMKALLFAPTEEVNIDKSISGSAISLASFIGYLPLVICYSLYGNILDRFDGLLGYKILFGVIIMFGIIGVLINRKLINLIDTKK